jgi:hypothetical protein
VNTRTPKTQTSKTLVTRSPLVLPVTPARLKEVVMELATAIDRRRLRPTIAELDSLAYLCDRAHLPAEAARIRRWLGHESTFDPDLLSIDEYNTEGS